VKAAAKAGATAPTEIISEHAPVWQEAVIQVSDVHKGPAQKKMVVRFPASTDVKWRKAPRFKKGQQGTWLLHAGATPAGARATKAAAPAAPEYYTALDPDDFHTGTEASVLQAMLPRAGSAPAVSARSAPKAKAVKKAGAAKKAPKAKRRK
jgi:hypothetical protein